MLITLPDAMHGLFTLFVASDQRSVAESLTVTTFVSNFKYFAL